MDLCMPLFDWCVCRLRSSATGQMDRTMTTQNQSLMKQPSINSLRGNLAGLFEPVIRGLVITGAALVMAISAMAHEPVFSLGPETIYQGGVGVETGFEFDQGEEEQATVLHSEILYGLTKNVTVTLSVPQILDSRIGGVSESGLGDISLRGKYNFFKKDSLGASHKMTGILGVKLSTGNENNVPALGSGTTDILTGFSYGYESRTWYHFLTLRYLARTKDQSRKPGDRFFYTLAFGYRPWQREYLEWDFVGLLEMDGEFDYRNEFQGQSLPNSGGNTIWLGPTGLFSYRNIMIKGGVQFPVFQDFRGNQPKDKIRAIFAAEYHF